MIKLISDLENKRKDKNLNRYEYSFIQVTAEKFAELKNEVKLYKKLHLDYDKRLEALEKERTEEEKKMYESRRKLEER